MRRFGWVDPIVIVGLALVVVVVVGLIFAMDASERDEQDRERAAIREVNRACLPGRPARVEHHGPGWSTGPYWEIECADGSIRLVKE